MMCRYLNLCLNRVKNSVIWNQNFDNILITGERVKPFCVTELAPGQVLTKMNMTFINKKNAKTKGPLKGCDQIKSILQMTRTNVVNPSLSINFLRQNFWPLFYFGQSQHCTMLSPLLTTHLCFTIAYILLSAYAFYLDQLKFIVW